MVWLAGLAAHSCGPVCNQGPRVWAAVAGNSCRLWKVRWEVAGQGALAGQRARIFGPAQHYLGRVHGLGRLHGPGRVHAFEGQRSGQLQLAIDAPSGKWSGVVWW